MRSNNPVQRAVGQLRCPPSADVRREMSAQTSPSINSSPLLNSFEQVGKLASLIGSALLFLSVLYDFSFLAALGLHFSEVPTTISDHIRSAIVWVPQVGGMVLVFLVYELAMRRIEGGKTEDELIASSTNPKFTRTFRASADALIPILGLISIAGWLIFGSSYIGLYLVFIMLWGFLSISVVSHARLGQSFDRMTARLFVLVPIAAAIVGSFGYGEGERLLTAKDANWEVTVADADKRTAYQVVGVRRFESVVIVVDMQRKILLYPVASIVSAKYKSFHEQGIINGCRWFGILCTIRASESKLDIKTSNPPLQGTPASRRP
jgi:hypothetical protein